MQLRSIASVVVAAAAAPAAVCVYLQLEIAKLTLNGSSEAAVTTSEWFVSLFALRKLRALIAFRSRF